MLYEYYFDFFTQSMKKIFESIEKMQQGTIQAIEQYFKLLSSNIDSFKK